MNEEAAAFVWERFGIKGVNLDTLEQVFNPLKSGNASLHATRTHLIKKGMTTEMADSLAKRYIFKLEQSDKSHVCSIMDFFDSHKSAAALNTLLKAKMSDVHFSYQTWDQYL